MGYLTYVCLCRLGGEARFLLWETGVEADAPDRVVAEPSGRVPSFGSEGEARAYADALGAPASEQPPVVYDLDRLAAWCERPGEATLDCEAALEAWNLFADLPAPAGGESAFRRADRAAGALYDKLFFGTNLPAVTPVGASYTPLWEPAELARLSHALRLGMAELAGRLSSRELSN